VVAPQRTDAPALNGSSALGNASRRSRWQDLFEGFGAARLSHGDRPSRLQTALWCCVILATAVVSLKDYDSFQLGAYRDDATYVVLAQSLAQGPVYGLINSPLAPGQSPFPFGYPFLLVVASAGSPYLPEMLKAVSLVATLASAGLIFFGWRRFSSSTSYWWALAVTALFLLSPLTVKHTRMVMSEPVFTLLCLVAVAIVPRPHDRATVARSALLGVIVTLAVFTRTVGVTLAAALVLYFLLRAPRSAPKAVVSSGLLAVGSLALLTLLTPVSLKDLLPAPYVDQVLTVGRPTVAPKVTNPGGPRPVMFLFSYPGYRLRSYFAEAVPETLLPLGGEPEHALADRLNAPWLPIALGTAVALTLLLGMLHWIRREGLSAVHLFTLLYLGLLLFWVWDDVRLLYPMQPMLFACSLFGVHALTRLASSGLPSVVTRLPWRGLAATVVSLLVVTSVYRSARTDDSRAHTGDLSLRSTWIKANTQPGSVIMTEEPQIDYIYAGRKTLPIPSPNSLAADPTQLTQVADYVLIAPPLTWASSHSDARYSPTGEAARNRLAFLEQDGNVELVDEEADGLEIFKINH
jgi:hypothetical protein